MKRSLAPRRRDGLVGLVAATLLAGMALPAAATTVSDCVAMCGAGTGACTIDSTVNVEPGSDLDCSGRDLTITNNGMLKVTDGAFTLLADDLVVYGAAGTITAVEGPAQEPGGISIELTGNLVLSGKIRADGQHGGGAIDVDAAGNITIPESGTDGIEADGTGSGADGGSVHVEAGGSIAIYDPIHASGAGSSGSSGGTIEIRAQGDIITDVDGHVSAEGLDGGGGNVQFASLTGDVLVREHIDVEGRGTYGNGGHIEIEAADRVELTQQITARGGVNTSGGSAAGGTIDIRSGCGGVSVGGNLLANGGTLQNSSSRGGAISIASGGNVAVASAVRIDVHSLATTGSGGAISINAGRQASVAASAILDARAGTSSPGRAGSIRATGCSLSLASSATLDSSGFQGGSITLDAIDVVPATGPQPLRIPTGVVLRVAGSSATRDGTIVLASLHKNGGSCSNDGTRRCFLDVDCTVGCQTGDCLNANPDTDGVGTQFDRSPSRPAELSLGYCNATCAP